MHALIVHSHPEPTSFNSTLKDVAFETLTRQGYSVDISDLYAEGFDPVEMPEHYMKRADAQRFAPLAEQRHASKTNSLPDDVVREISRLERADLVVLQFPLWWHAQPAILKGWFDRVFVNGALYTSTMRYDNGYFRGKRAICSVTTGAPASTFVSGARGGDIEVLLWPIQYSLYYMGFSVLPPFLAYGIQGHGYTYKDEETFKRELDGYTSQWAERLEDLENADPLEFPGWSDWEETVSRAASQTAGCCG